MTSFDWLTIFGTATSIVLGVLAIALSLVFFRMSADQNQESRRNAQQISESVSRLEKLFDSLYNDTFSMMRETVTDMRGQIFRRPESFDPDSLKTRELGQGSVHQDQLASLKEEMLRTVEAVSARIGVTDANVARIQTEIRPALEDAVKQSQRQEREVRSREAQLEVLATIDSRRRRGRTTDIQSLNGTLGSRGFSGEEIVTAVFDLRGSGEITWDGPSGQISATEEIVRVRDNLSYTSGLTRTDPKSDSASPE